MLPNPQLRTAVAIGLLMMTGCGHDYAALNSAVDRAMLHRLTNCYAAGGGQLLTGEIDVRFDVGGGTARNVVITRDTVGNHKVTVCVGTKVRQADYPAEIDAANIVRTFVFDSLGGRSEDPRFIPRYEDVRPDLIDRLRENLVKEQ